MPLRKEFPDELIADCKQRYEDTDEPTAEIAESLGIHRRTFHDLVNELNWAKRSERPPRDVVPPEAAPRDHAPPTSQLPAAWEAPAEAETSRVPAGELVPTELGLVARVERAIEHDLAAIERVIAQLRGGGGRMQEAERAARTLASLTRTLKDISGLRGTDNVNAEEDDIPRDIEDLRRVLAQRLDRLEREEGIDSDNAGDDPPGTDIRK